MIDSILQNSKELNYHEIELLADEIVESITGVEGMTYALATKVLQSHEAVYAEALKHLYHNAAIEIGERPISYVLNKQL